MSDLPIRTLGRTGLEVTVLGYGAMELRDEPRGRPVEEHVAERILGAVLDSGINLIDTSIDYGLAEERMGRYIAHRRDEYVLTGKCGCVVGAALPRTGSGPHDYHRDNIVAGVEQSLRRMDTDHLDVLQVHLSPSVAELEREDVIGTLQDLQAQGKTRFLGMSGILPDLPEHIALGVFDVFQIPYSAVEREHERLIDDAAAAGAGVLVRGGAAKGAPSGEEHHTSRAPKLADTWERAGLDDLLDGMSSMEFTLRFTITHPSMTTTIVGTINPDHLAANLQAVAAGPLPADVYEEAKRRLDAAGSTPAT